MFGEDVAIQVDIHFGKLWINWFMFGLFLIGFGVLKWQSNSETASILYSRMCSSGVSQILRTPALLYLG